MEHLQSLNLSKQEMLESALEKLSGYRTMQCGQVHEKIVSVTKVEERMLSHDDYPGWKLQIKGLCSKEVRNATLGCSHSMVQANYGRLISQLVTENIIGETTVPWTKINDVLGKVFIMDYEKGSLEKKLAVMKGKNSDSAVIEEIQFKLSRLREEHVILINQLDALHRDTLQTLQEIVHSRSKIPGPKD